MKKPNIVVIISDDHGHWALGCAGNKELQTPHLDRIAQGGIRFENLFCASPVCSPARASLFTGKIPSQHGVHDWISKGHANESDASEALLQEMYKEKVETKFSWITQQLKGDHAINYLEGHTCFTEILTKIGYTCGLSGKWHLGDSATPQLGFSYWQTIALGGDHYYNAAVLKDGKFDILPEGKYLTDHITDKAMDFLETQKNKEEPFYLSVHYTAPHAPWDKSEHPEEFYSLYENCPFESVEDEEGHPWGPYHSHTKEQMKQAKEYSLRGYYAAISAMDKGIGEILDYLDEQGLAEDTIIFFTGDNGMSVGQHGIIGKGNGTFPMNMYDTAVKVPGLLRYPRGIKGGQVKDELVSHYDIMPTLLDYLQVDHNIDLAELPGRSFLPVLKSEEPVDQGEIIIMDEYGPTRMIRTKEWKYIHRYPYGDHELYDLKNDPQEKINLVKSPEHRAKREELLARLETWYYKYADPKVDGKGEPVKGNGQLEKCGIYKKGKTVFTQ
ncbi:MAG: sulfatase-like hydrolase/transferase [Niameybacter sp.]|uniref:sulfatase-like hydrolase/transferase n=1 Tax=Niameybacter sp. TaxID=2033640 RepID=UPI002FC6CB27